MYYESGSFNSEIFQVINYYPKYSYLDDIISRTGRKTLNIYVDLKGCLQTLYQKWAVDYLLSRTRTSNLIDTTVFLSVLEYISWHKIYAKKRDINLNLFFFFESGKSTYHLEILPEYKKQRMLGDFFGLDTESRELFFKILDKNYQVIEKVCSKIPNVSVIRLRYLEADFVPYYLINRALSNSDECAHVIYSMDKDMLQCLNKKNIFLFYRHYKYVKTVSCTDIYSHFLKIDDEIDPQWFEMFLAILGDSSDEFKGIPGIGMGTLKQLYKQIIVLCESMENVYSKIKTKQNIFNDSYSVNKQSKMGKIIDNQDIIIRNLKLLSFKILSDQIDNGFPLYMVDQKKVILENISVQNKIPNASVFITALEKTGLHVDERTICNMF